MRVSRLRKGRGVGWGGGWGEGVDFRGERAYVAKISKLLVMVGFADTRTCV